MDKEVPNIETLEEPEMKVPGTYQPTGEILIEYKIGKLNIAY